MAYIKEHYDKILSEYYSWVFGGLENNIKDNIEFFLSSGLIPRQGGIALDLGAGSGFQSIPLGQLGYKIISIDFSEELLAEIKQNSNGLQITTINDDILNFKKYVTNNVELCVCMGDTLTHLTSLEDVKKLLSDVFDVLEKQGTFVLSFRDLTKQLTGLDRIIPVRSEKDKIFTCFLEYEKDKVKVTDILYQYKNKEWQIKKSYYRKIKISKEWIITQMEDIGYLIVQSSVDNGMVKIIAKKE
ncbi:MAG: class I SAM-dependent methyltransferase [bacterium]